MSDPPGLVYRSARGRWVVLATVLGSGMTGIDATVVGIALPVIGRHFHSGVVELQWVSNAYMLTLSGLLLLGGALGDRYGRRRYFQIGTIWFTAASLLCGFAPSVPILIAARALQGVGAALLTPGSLAILQASFVPDDRSRAIGAWSGLGGVATAAGPLVGGWLISAVSWRLVFLINLPVSLVVLAVASRHVPESRDPSRDGPLDVRGAVSVSLGLTGLAYGLTDGASLGWGSPVTLACLIGGTALLVVFSRLERSRPGALMPPGIFRSLQFSGANLMTFVVYGALGGSLFLLPITLEQVLGFSPLAAGLSLLPVTVLMLALSPRSGALAARIGPRLQMTVGPLFVGAGLVLLVMIRPGGDYLHQVLPGVVVLGFGLSVMVAPLTAAVLAAAPNEQAGIASAINNDVARAAALVAVALVPSLAGIKGDTYLHAAVLSAGFHRAMWITAGACVLGAAAAGLTIRNRLAMPSPAVVPEGAPGGIPGGVPATALEPEPPPG